MSLGEVNKGMIAFVLLLLVAASGYLWYSKMYTPALATKQAAETAATTAEGQLTAAQQQLEEARKQVEDAKKEVAKLDDSVARLAKARTAIPSRKLLDDATIYIVENAVRSGIQIKVKAGSENGEDVSASTTGASSLDGATPIDLEFKAAGTYDEMIQFMQLVESNVDRKDGKLYTRGRLFNVVSLEIGEDKDDSGGGGFSESGGDTEGGFVMGPNDIKFTVVVRMYSSSTENSGAVGVQTPDDPAAAGTDPAAAGGTDPAAGGTGTTPGATDPAAGGAQTGTDPAAAGGTATDPAAGGATGTDPAAGGGATDPLAGGGADPAATAPAATGGVS